MKQRSFTILVFFLTIMQANAQTPTTKYFDADWQSCKKQKASYYRLISYDSKGSPTGVVKDFYINGQLQWEGHLYSENPDVNEGLCKWYYSNGQLSQTSNFKAGVKHGKFVWYYDNGQIKEIIGYENGQLDGERKLYFQSGKLKRDEYFIQDKPKGTFTIYYENGNTYSMEKYVDGKLNGDAKYYYESGEIKSYIVYDKNEPIYNAGYARNGNKTYEYRYSDPKTYTYKEWTEDGKLKDEKSIVDEKVDAHIKYETSGKIVLRKISDSLMVHPAKDLLDCLYGFKNKRNEWVIEPRFETVTEDGDFYIVTLHDKYGVLDFKGNELIPLIYDNIRFTRSTCKEPCFYEERKYNKGLVLPGRTNLFIVEKDNRWGVSNQDHQIILPIQYDHINNLVNGHLVFYNYRAHSMNRLYGFMDTLGSIVQPKYRELSDFNEDGYAVIKQDHGFYKLCVREPVEAEKLENEHDYESSKEFGAIDAKGNILIPCKYDWIHFRSDKGVIWVGKNGKLGAYNLDGGLLLETKYTRKASGIYLDSLVVLELNGKYGVFHASGDIIIPSEYDSIVLKSKYWEVPNLLIPVKQGEKWVAIDRKGNRKSEKFDELDAFKGSFGRGENNNMVTFLLARKKDKYGVIDENGQTVIDFDYNFAFFDKTTNTTYNFLCLIKRDEFRVFDANKLGSPVDVKHLVDRESGYLEFCLGNIRDHTKNYDHGLVNSEGKVILLPEYEIENFNNEYFLFENRDGEVGILNTKGEILITSNNIESFQNIVGPYAGITTKAGHAGMFNLEQKRLIIDTVYEAITMMDTLYKICWVKSGNIEREEIEDEYYTFLEGGWKLVNENGAIISRDVFSFPCAFHDSVSNERSYPGVINVEGKTIVPFEFDEIKRQQNGLFLIKSEKWGLADKYGNIMIEPAWDDVSSFLGGYAVFWQDSLMGVVDSTGKIVVEARDKDFSKLNLELENMFRFYETDLTPEEDQYGESQWIYKLFEMQDVIEAWNRIDSFFSINPNPKVQRKIKNLLISKMVKNYAYGNFSGGCNYNFYYDVEITVPGIYSSWYNSFGYDNDCSYEESNYDVSVEGITRQSISYAIAETNSYEASRGPGHSNRYYSFYNFSTTEFTSLHLSDLFLGNSNYEDVLIHLIIEEIEKLDDTEIACYKPSEYFELLKDRFAIRKEGLMFYMPYHHEDFNIWEENVKLFIPYSDIGNVIDKRSVLGKLTGN